MKETWDDDRDPLARLREGDPGPFEAFVVSETATFLAFFQRLGANRAEADDLVQDLFLKLFRHAETYQRQGKFRAYAFRVARNAWIDRARRSAGRAEGVGEDPEETARVDGGPVALEEEPGAGLARREEVERLQSALADLPDHHRLVFELGVVQELPYGEISEVLSIPVGTVKSRMFHAVRKLRDALGDGEGEA